MKKNKLLVFLYFLLIAGILNAQQQVSKSEARQAAINILYKKSDVLRISYNTEIGTVHSFYNRNGDTLMYEVVFENGATILLSGSKACQPVLGYYVKNQSDKSSVFDTTNINVPCGLQALLNDYAKEIEWCFSQGNIALSYQNQWNELQQSNYPTNNLRTYTEVLLNLTTQWGQWVSNDYDCYRNSNKECISYKQGDSEAYNFFVTSTQNSCNSVPPSNKCPLGCAAVAMGQVMYYWKYPMTYDWCNMHYELRSNRPNYVKERNVIAGFLKDCADAANTFYCIAGTCNSSATLIYDTKHALVNHFDYSTDITHRLRSSYITNTPKWKKFITDDLDNGRPVIYGSLGTNADGHWWVIHGYNSNDEFYMNFGWNGGSDGWYTLNGLGSVGTPPSNYNQTQEALFDIYPSTNENYCNYTFSLDNHFAAGGTHQNVPQTYMKLETASATSPAAWRTIQSGQSAEYVAHERIVLKQGFKAESGSYFKARIEPCNNCNSAKVAVKSLKNGVEIEEELYIAVGDSEEEQPLGEGKTIAEEPQVYPNPTTGVLTIDTKNENNRIQMIELYNMQGTKLFTFNGNNSLFQEIDISHLPSQVYNLKIQVSGQVFTKKLVLQK